MRLTLDAEVLLRQVLSGQLLRKWRLGAPESVDLSVLEFRQLWTLVPVQNMITARVCSGNTSRSYVDCGVITSSVLDLSQISDSRIGSSRHSLLAQRAGLKSTCVIEPARRVSLCFVLAWIWGTLCSFPV